MPSKKENKITLIIIILTLCIPFALGLAYKYRSELKLEKRFSQIKETVFSRDAIIAKIDFFAKVNNRDMRIIFKIPCKDMKTKEYIQDNMTRIKHEMLMSMDDEQNKISIEKRDFGRIKANCLQVLKKYSAIDADKVYVDFFAHN